MKSDELHSMLMVNGVARIGIAPLISIHDKARTSATSS
jgi:hypothetical protein